MASEYAIELSDYVDVLWRRRKQIIGPAIALAIASVAAAYLITPAYKSAATIMVESPEIPTDLVQTTVTGFVEERLQAMQARILTDERLWAIVEELDLYAEDRSEGNVLGLVELFRASIGVEPVSVVATTTTGAKAQATIALEVSFLGDSPETAQEVANYLADLLLTANRDERERQVASVSEFLEEQAQRIGFEMAQLEEKLAAFKRKEMDQLPELMNLNLRQLEQSERSIEETKDKIRALQDNQIFLEAELALTSRYRERFTEAGDRVLSAEEKLTTLTVEFLAASGRYSPDHPDMIRMRREIETLAGQSGGSGRIGALVAELQVARAELIEARRNYSDDHPDVKRLANKVATLERSARAAAQAPLSGGGQQYNAPPDNPQYVVLQTQLRTTKENLVAERARLERLREAADKYTHRLSLTPSVEQAYLTLSRGYDSASRKYADVKDKQLQALLAERLEKQELAGRFTLLESAKLNYTPEEPNRKAIILVGTMLGIMCGIGFATFAEFFDGSVRGFRGVEAIFGAPPLAAIQYIDTKADIDGRRRHALSISLASGAGLVAVVLILHLFWMPVDEIWQAYSPWAEPPEPTEEET